MPAPVIVKGIADMREIEAAFASVAARAKTLNQQVARDQHRTDLEAAKSAQQAAKARVAATTSAAKLQEKILLDSAKSHNRIVLDAAKTDHRAALEASKAKMRIAQEEVRAHARAEKEKTKATATEAKQRAQAVARENQRAQSQRRSGLVNGIASAGARAVRSTYGTVMGAAQMVTGGSAGMLMYSALSDNVALRSQAALLVNATRDKSGNATQSTEGLTKEAQGIASKYGISANDVMGGMRTVAARAGGAEGLAAYRQDLDDIAKTARAFGVSMQDMGGVVAAALKAGVKPGEEMRTLIQDIAAQGKDGAIEIEDLAQELAKLGGAGKLTELSHGGMLRRMAGFAQIAADAAVSPEESRTAVKDVVRDLNTQALTLKGAGIQTHGKTGLLNDPAVLVAETIDVAMKKGMNIHGKNLKGSDALNKIFTGTSQNVIASLMGDYQSGGKEGVLKRLNDASGATLAKGERDRGLAEVMSGPAAQLAQNMEKFKAAMGEALPSFTKLIPVLASATEGLAKVAGWAAQNPIPAVGAMIATHLTTEIMGAGIGAAVKSAILAAIGGGTGGLPIPGAPVPGKGGGVVGTIAKSALALTAAGLAGFEAGKELSESAQASGTQEGQRAFDARIRAQNLLSSGKGSKQELIQAMAAVQTTSEAGKGGAGFGWKDLALASPAAGGMMLYHAYQAMSGMEAKDKSAAAGGADALIAELQAAIKRASITVNVDAKANLPNQSGAPTSATPTSSSLMK